MRPLPLLALIPALAFAQGAPAAPKETTLTNHAHGAFEVKVAPLKGDDEAWGGFGRLSLDKQFHGDLEAASKGQMMAWGTGTGPGAYVALEKVTGTLKGRSGSFVLVHQGTMTGAGFTLSVSVAPGSGTEGLAGLEGQMDIRIEKGQHGYSFDYSLPALAPKGEQNTQR